jgi:DNA polymerase III subunit epsilon
VARSLGSRGSGVSLDFVSIDFETANSFRGSPCAVGMARVRDGIVVETASTLMQPPDGYGYFDPWNIRIHGITPDQVKDAPVFASAWPSVLEFIGGDTVVAHNASFDLGVIREACTASDLPWPNMRYACTLVLARKTYDLLSYSLPFVVEAAGRSLDDHHDAGADALAAAHIMLDMAARCGARTIDELLATHGVLFGLLDPAMWSGCKKTPGTHLHTPEVNPDADPEHPLYGQVVVFTGALQTMTRPAAWERVAFVGGKPAASPNKHTMILVEGMQDPTRLRPGMALSTKAEKVQTLRAKGQSIEIMGEPEFLALLADDRASGFRPAVVDEARYRSWSSVL